MGSLHSIEFGSRLRSPSVNETVNNLVGLPVLSDNDHSFSVDELVQAGFKKEAAERLIADYQSILDGRSSGAQGSVIDSDQDYTTFVEGLKVFVSEANNIASQDPNPWHALLENGKRVWRATDPALRDHDVDHIQVGKGIHGSAFSDFEVYDKQGKRMAQFLIAIPSHHGQLNIYFDPKRKCSADQFNAGKCQQQPDLLEINKNFVSSHPTCAESVAAYAGSYTCSTTSAGCIGPTLFYSGQHGLTFGVDGLAFFNGREEGSYNTSFGGYILFDQRRNDFEIVPRTAVVVDGVAYDLTDATQRQQFESTMASSTHLSGFQSIRLVDDDQKANGWRGAPYGAGQLAATRRAIGHVGWISGNKVERAQMIVTIERSWTMPEGGQFLNRLDVVEAMTTNTGGWGPGYVVRKDGSMDTSLPADPARRINPRSHAGSGWYEADSYAMTVHACSPKGK